MIMSDGTVIAPVIGSTYVKALGYNKDTFTMYIKFKGATVFAYDEVPEAVYQELKDSPGKGTYVHQNIMGKYAYRVAS